MDAREEAPQAAAKESPRTSSEGEAQAPGEKKRAPELPGPDPMARRLPAAGEALYDESAVLALARHLVEDSQVRTHYYVKICVSAFLCALLLLIGVPVFMESRVTGSLAYTALGVVLVGFGLVLAVAVVVLLFHPPFKPKRSK